MLSTKMDAIINANLAIDGVWPLPSPRASDALKEQFELSEKLPEEIAAFTKGWDEDQLDDLTGGDSDTWEHLMQSMMAAGWCGFVMAVSTPVVSRWRGHKSYSWGHTWTETVIATTLEEAIDKALAWAEVRSTDIGDTE